MSLNKFVVFVFFYCVSVSHGEENEGPHLSGPGEPDNDWEYSPYDYDIPTARPNLTSSSCHDCESSYPAKMQTWRAAECSQIDLCPVFGGTASASSNTENAEAAFKFEGHWTSDMLSQSELPNQWLQISFKKSRSLIFFGFDETGNEAVTEFRLQGANGDISLGPWSEITFCNRNTRTSTHYEVLGTSEYQHYRLLVNETMWSNGSAPTGRISIGNFQMCFSDDFGSSPPETKGRPFSKTRYSSSYHEKYAFKGLKYVWCSERLSKNTTGCRENKMASKYRGNLRVTDSGNNCKDWTSTGYRRPNAGLTDNFCRNPNRHINGPWCYTGLPRPNHWGLCDVPYCDQAGWHAEEFIGWEFKEPKTIREFSFMTTMKNSWKAHHPTVFIFQGSNNKQTGNWTDLTNVKNPPALTIKHKYVQKIKRENLQPFKAYRLLIRKAGWMQTGGTSGFVHVRNFVMC